MQITDLRRDINLSTDGIWRDFNTGEVLREPHAERFCVRVAYAQNPRARDLQSALRMARHTDLVAAQDDAERLEAILQDIETEVLATAILTGWANIDDEDGNPLPYSPEKAREYMCDPDYYMLRSWVRDISNVDDSYRKAETEQAVGN